MNPGAPLTWDAIRAALARVHQGLVRQASGTHQRVRRRGLLAHAEQVRQVAEALATFTPSTCTRRTA